MQASEVPTCSGSPVALAEGASRAGQPRTWRYCARCVLPDSRPGLTLDSSGVCTACREHARRDREIDWSARADALRVLFDEARRRSSGYDCIVPVSGGKDSTWQVVTCLQHGLRVLAVTWRTPGRTTLGQRNLDNLRRLGVDHIDYSIDERVERVFTRLALRRTGSTGVPMHMAVYAIPLRLAVALRVPLVVWGENPHAEYGRTDRSPGADRLDPQWGRRHGIQQGTGPEDWVGLELSERDLAAYLPPSAAEFEASGVNSLFLGEYLRWDPEMSRRVAADHGFEARREGPRVGLYEFADVDCAFISVHHHFKWLKFGFTRLFDNLSLEIRHGRLTRAEAVERIRASGDQTPHADIAALCEFIEIDRAEFRAIEERFRNRSIWSCQDGVWRIPGFLVPDWTWR